MGVRSSGNFRVHMFQVTAQTRSRAGSEFMETRDLETTGVLNDAVADFPDDTLPGFTSS